MLKTLLNSKFCKLTILQCYLPSNKAEKEDKVDRYEQLEMAVSKLHQHEMLLITCDKNAKVGTRQPQLGVDSTRISISKHLADFCLNNNLVIAGTIFQHKNIHKLTWNSPDGKTIKQPHHNEQNVEQVTTRCESISGCRCIQ